MIERNWQLVLLVNQAQLPKVDFVFRNLAGDLLVFIFHHLVRLGLLTFVRLSGCLLFLSAQLSGTFAFLIRLFLLLLFLQLGTVFGQLSIGGKRELRLEP